MALISNGDQALAIQTRYDISHDNTLSGTGTVSSPLGVTTSAMPGYETVLWSGDQQGGNYVLSDNPYNYEEIALYGSFQSPNVQYFRINTDYVSSQNSAFNIGGIALDRTSNGIFYLRDATYNMTTSSISGVIGWQALVSATSITNHSTSDYAFCVLQKIVGINRKEEA